MKLIVGLGNPETKYHWTRHNSGFLALDYYFKAHKLNWEEKPRYGAIFGRKDEILFVKPQDYYNESGLAVQKFVNFYKIPLSDILVICDDFNLEFGKIRYRQAGSAGGNNGLKSIIKMLGTEDFARIRVGTGNDELRKKIGDTDFVLSKWTPEEKEKIPEVLRELSEKIDSLI